MNADFSQTRGSDAYARMQQQQLLRDVSRVEALNVGKNAAKAGKHAYGVLGGAKAAKGAKDYITLAKLVGGAGAKAGIAGVRAMGSRGIKDAALALIRAMQLADATPRVLYPSQNAQLSPYEMMQMMGTPLGEI